MKLEEIFKVLEKKININQIGEEIREICEKRIIQWKKSDFPRKDKEKNIIRLERQLQKCPIELAKESICATFVEKNKEIPVEYLREIWKKYEGSFCAAFAKNPQTPPDILEEIHQKGGYDSYLATNPKTPPYVLAEIFERHYPYELTRYTDYVSNSRRNWKHRDICRDLAMNPNLPQKNLEKLAQGESVLPKDQIQGWFWEDKKDLEVCVAANTSISDEMAKELFGLGTIGGRSAILANSGISEKLFYELIGFDEDVVKGKKEISITENFKEYATSIAQNENLSEDMIRRIEVILAKEEQKEKEGQETEGIWLASYAIDLLLKNPKTPKGILKKYSQKIDYSKVGKFSGDDEDRFRSLAANPNTPPETIAEMVQELEKYPETLYDNIYVILPHPNMPNEYLLKYLSIDTEQSGGVRLFDSILSNPRIFEFLQEMGKDMTSNEGQNNSRDDVDDGR